MQIETTRFGRIEIADDAVIAFPRGLYGLDQARAYCLIERDGMGCFQWLQAADAPAIALVVADPFSFFPDYQVEIPDSAAELLQATASTDVAIYTTLTIAAQENRLYTNLLGPLVINPRAGIGMQIIQDATRYQPRHLLPVAAPAYSGSGGAEPPAGARPAAPLTVSARSC